MRLVRAASLSLLLLAAATIACAVIALSVTQDNDRRFAIERHAALQTALDELHAVFGDLDRFDYGQLRLIERRSGLKDVRFEADAAREPGREMQSLQDAHGRIVGWFSWTPDRRLILAMDWLWGLAGAIGVVLMGCAIVVGRTAQRMAAALTASMATVHKLSTADVLTGLPNQRTLLKELDRALARRDAGRVAFALLDLDGFREVDDAVGPKGCDEVLLTIAERLRASLPADVLLGRFEDDAFAAIASGNGDRIGATLAEGMRAAFTEPIVVDEVWQISGSVGIAQAPEDGTSAEDLSRAATLALRTAQRAGRGAVRRFEPQIEREIADRRFLLRELKTAVAQQTFDVHYQPIVSADGAGIVGVEALLRWSHPVRGAIAPSVFIPLAEQNRLMTELGEIVLRRALGDAARWPGIFVAVNLSPVQIRDQRLVDLVRAVMSQSGVEPSRVVLEMTEGILIDKPEETAARLHALRELGVGMALDDFGTGYSSLSYLQKFPFQRVKIDRTFVASLGSVGNAGAIIHSIVTLGHALGMSVLAEGIETKEQRVLLRLAGCDEMQGFLFARPGPAEAIDAMLCRSRGAASESSSAS